MTKYKLECSASGYEIRELLIYENCGYIYKWVSFPDGTREEAWLESNNDLFSLAVEALRAEKDQLYNNKKEINRKIKQLAILEKVEDERLHEDVKVCPEGDYSY